METRFEKSMTVLESTSVTIFGLLVLDMQGVGSSIRSLCDGHKK